MININFKFFNFYIYIYNILKYVLTKSSKPLYDCLIFVSGIVFNSNTPSVFKLYCNSNNFLSPSIPTPDLITLIRFLYTVNFLMLQLIDLVF